MANPYGVYNQNQSKECIDEDKVQESPVLQKMDKSFEYELETYTKLLSVINSKIDNFKCRPTDDKGCGKVEPCKSSSEYFYSIGEKLQKLSNLNKELELIYNRLNEIL